MTPAAAALAVDIRALRKAYNGRAVLAVSALRLPAGGVALLQGENGAGKTTLLRVVAGLCAVDSCGRFAVLGAAKPRPPQTVLLHQTPHLFSGNVAANVEYGLRRCNLPLARAGEAMQWAGVEHLARRPAAELSGGEARRVALARLRALRPRLYLLDEPLAHLDSDGEERMRDLLNNLQKEGATAIIASHKPVAAATTRWLLKNGDIAEDKI